MLLDEILCDILLRSGGVLLLRSISTHLNKAYCKMIGEYNLAIKPISVEEIEHYLDKKPNIIYRFDYRHSLYSNLNVTSYNNCNTINYSYKPFSSLSVGSNVIYYGPAGMTHDRFETDVELITQNRAGNYDLFTMYNILTERMQDEKLVNKICLDTFLYYCDLLTDQTLYVYLYVNVYSFIPDLKWEFPQYDINKIETYRNLIMNQLNKMTGDITEYYQYSNYVIPRLVY